MAHSPEKQKEKKHKRSSKSTTKEDGHRPSHHEKAKPVTVPADNGSAVELPIIPAPVPPPHVAVAAPVVPLKKARAPPKFSVKTRAKRMLLAEWKESIKGKSALKTGIMCRLFHTMAPGKRISALALEALIAAAENHAVGRFRAANAMRRIRGHSILMLEDMVDAVNVTNKLANERHAGVSLDEI